jgi:uncharacterized integral membrane protein
MAEDQSGETSGGAPGGPGEEAGVSSSVEPRAEPGPSEDRPVFRGTGVSAALVVGVVLAILAVIVAVQNTEHVNIDFLAWELDAPLVAVILAAAVAGVVLDEILGFFWRRRRRRHLAERAELQRLRHP